MKNTRNKIVTGILMVIFMITLDTHAQNVELGARFMPTFSSFKIHSNDGGTLKGEFTAGYGYSGFIGINFTDNFGIQGEVMYNKLSQKYSETDNAGTINLEYINIPLLLSLNTGKSKPVNLNFVIGPQIGFNVGAEVEPTKAPDTYEATLVVKKNDLGLAYGAGVDFGLNSEKTFRLGVGYRGVIGLINISDKSSTSETEDYYILEKTNIKTFAIYAGISFLF
jgi:hypothetical protein